MKKRVFSILLALGLAVTALAGCGGEQEAQDPAAGQVQETS